MYITGNVVLSDGAQPPERVIIERLCASFMVRFEGYTDSRGNFGIQLGQSQQLIPDASTSMFVEESQGFTTPTREPKETLKDIYYDCELRARLAGYTSSTLLLSGRRPLDPPQVGTLVLSPIAKVDGHTISATSAAAPKDARKALEKGLAEAKKAKYDKAEIELRRAVDLHPRYAEAWMELGKVYRMQLRVAAARTALAKAVAADPNFVAPYEQLYQIAFDEGKWQEVADLTQRTLSLNPYNFPDAYYFNGVAHYRLHNLDMAEVSLAQAIKADRFNNNPKTQYVMGLVMFEKNQLDEASKRLQIFAQLAPKDPQVPKARAIIDQIEKSRIR
jgi:tetratricopeptide (TPR) repeat protein